MKRTVLWLGLAWLGCAAWLGCNALLGNESAVFDPDAGAPADGGPDRAGDDAAALDAGDAADAEDDTGPPCVDLDKNPRHCGACNHDCRGGECVDGGCLPVLLASDLPGPGAIAVDGTHVYWLNEATGDLWSVPIDGGAKALLYDGPDGAPGNSIAIHGGNVYVGSGELDAGIVRCAAPSCAGGPSYEITNRDVPVSVFVTTSGSLYFAQTVPSGSVERCQLPCTIGTQILASGSAQSFPDHVAVGPDGTLFWTTTNPFPGRLHAQPQGGSPSPVATGSISAVTPASGEVYYIEEGNGPSAAPLDGGAARRLRSIPTHGHHLALGADDVYATESQNDFVYACNRATGCGDAGIVLARQQPSPRGIALDATFIYWANQGNVGTGGQIMRLAR